MEGRAKIALISRKSLWRHNPLALLSVWLIALVSALPAVLYISIGNYLLAADLQKQAVYGAFSDIYYQDAADVAGQDFWSDDSVLEEKLPGFRYAERGLMYAVQKITRTPDGACIFLNNLDTENVDRHKVLSLGYADEAYRALAGIKLSEGRWPQDADEVLLTEDARSILQLEQLRVGDRFTLLDRSWRLCGLAEAYGHLWEKDRLQLEKDILPLRVFVTQETAAEILASRQAWPEPYRIFLFDRGQEDNSKLAFSADARFFHNNNLRQDIAQEKYLLLVPGWYLLVLYGALFFISLMAISLFGIKRKPSYRTMMRLGLQVQEQRKLALFDHLLLALLGTLLSLFLAALLAWLTHLLITAAGGFHYAFHLPLALLLKFLGGSLLTNLLAFALALLISQHLLYAAPKDVKRGRKARLLPRHGFWRLAIWDWRRQWLSWLLLVVIFLVCAFLLEGNYRFSDRYKNNTPQRSWAGLMPMDYDYELLIYSTKVAPEVVTAEGMKVFVPKENQQEQMIFYHELQGYGMDEAAAERLRALPGIAKVKAYASLFHVQALQTFAIDTFIDEMDGTRDGRYEGYWDTVGEIKKYKAIEDPAVDMSLSTYPPEDIESFAAHVSEGRIDLDKLRRGEEIILVAADYQLIRKEYADKDGNISLAFSHSYSPESEAAANRLSSIRVGDDLDLMVLYSPEAVYGGLTKTEVDQYLSVEKRRVRVGAIIRERVGDFLGGSQTPSPLSLITVNGALNALHMPIKYDRLHLFAEAQADHAQLRTALDAVTKDYPAFKLKDLHAQLINYHSYGLFLEFFITSLMLLVSFVALALLLALLLSRLAAQRQIYSQLRLNGLSLRRVALIWSIEYFSAWLLALLVYSASIALRRFMEWRYAMENFVSIKFAKVIPFYLWPWAILLALLVLTIAVCVRRLKASGLRPAL